MKILLRRLTIVITVFVATQLARGQFAIDWFSIEGGGGTSTGSGYTLSGSIGQADASPVTLNGGSHALEGGFWPGVIVPANTGAPALFIQLAGNSVTISWAPAATGFSLEKSDSLLPGSWAPALSGASNPAMIPLGAGATFYRLSKQ